MSKTLDRAIRTIDDSGIKLKSGVFSYGQTLILEVDGKEIKRKVHYGSLDGLYIVIDGEKIGRKAIRGA